VQEKDRRLIIQQDRQAMQALLFVLMKGGGAEDEASPYHVIRKVLMMFLLGNIAMAESGVNRVALVQVGKSAGN
jgi:hypothetical protein